MSRLWGIMMATTAALLVGCAVEGQPTAQPPRTTTTTTSTASSPTAQAVITAACPLLTVEEITRILNNGKDSGIAPKEATPEDDDGGKIYVCDYGPGAASILGLSAREFPANGRTPAAVAESVGKASEAETTSLPGVGEAAVYYQTGGAVILAAVKQSGANLRLVTLSGPKIMPRDKLVELAKLAIGRV